MSELEDRISSVLNDPEQMARISAMAQQLLGGAAPSTQADGSSPAEVSPLSGLDGAALGKLGALLKGGEKSRQIRALEALAPFLQEKRRDKLTRAIRAAQLLRLAGAGLPGLRGGKDV